LEFRAIESSRYPVWEIKEELLKNPKSGVVVNAANEAAIAKFIAGRCGFLDISRDILSAYCHFESMPNTISDVFALDAEVRTFVESLS
jgi:1-deoxy-D-xylulose-5-phosphate reductoisomerase